MIRRMLADAYRRLAAPFGVRALDRMLRDGLPARLERPLRFLFTGEGGDTVDAVAARIEARRAEIAGREESYEFKYGESAAGVTRWPEQSSSESPISSRWLANSASVPRRWGVFLHLCAESATSILETGACVGISGAYFATAASHPRLITIEGSSALAPIAEETLTQFSDRATVMRSAFDDGIPRALQSLQTLDLAFIDGHHQEAATLRYVQTIIPHLSRDAMIILDDISLHPGMRSAWQQLSRMTGVAAAVDTGRFGLWLWEGGAVVPRQYDLARYTGAWRFTRFATPRWLRSRSPGSPPRRGD